MAQNGSKSVVIVGKDNANFDWKGRQPLITNGIPRDHAKTNSVL